ncbi:trypsin-like serine peptidase [Krasilnikovia sp. M28-CT-15]|uniref:trypsin-like serine peptidase n=1 Tax=Krasilnikovia sp. M28-CT-15 TaxID=3373540 RepID=UPI00399D30C2
MYVTVPDDPGQCSASALSSAKCRLVRTAGHCVHAGAGGGRYSDFIFVPGFAGGRFRVTARTAWVNNSNNDEDTAIAIMTNGGIYDATVGGKGLRWNRGYQVAVTILGYPAGGGFPGDVQDFCQGTTWNGHNQQVRAWCNRKTTPDSVVSHRHDNPDHMDRPHFDNDIKSLYDYAEGCHRRDPRPMNGGVPAMAPGLRRGATSQPV